MQNNSIKFKTFKTKFRNFNNQMQNFNPPKAICNHLIGKDHSLGHRVVVGSITILSGVLIANSGGEGMFHIITDCIGYLIHGIGALPFLEVIEKWRDKNHE